MVNVAIIGMGNMGCNYATMISNQQKMLCWFVRIINLQFLS